MASSASTKSSSTVVSAKMLPNFWFTADNDANYLMGFLDARKKAQTGGDKDQTQFREAIRYYEPFVRKHSENRKYFGVVGNHTGKSVHVLHHDQ